ncbi:alpha/beta fold hydrolase [Pendulispora albinea]|uniref:Lysophospholipase n=1 Tax=Pendulispora albinea TaxID=2741071 RepID=A0ABZ2LJW3_9BACT
MDELYKVDNGAGWRISLKRVAPAPSAAGAKRPALIVPGYGMNSFIFGFHPRGLSLEGYLASRGIEVWSVDLRGQGRAERRGGTDRFELAEMMDDVDVAVRHVLSHTKTGAGQVDLIGCSLGTALMFGYVAHQPQAPVRCLVNVGGLVTWVKIHPALRVAFHYPWLVGGLRIRHTRKMAGVALPVLARYAPKLLSVYMNVSSTDVTEAATMVQTVEDPNPHVNRNIAHWVAERELVMRGVNVSRALRGMHHPFLCIVANDDGIVPPETARDPYDAIGSDDKELLAVGDPTFPMAHADLFLSTGCQEKVFEKLAAFLLAR